MAGMTDEPVHVALVSVPTAELGAGLARTLVEEGLVACGTVVPGGTSVYRWDGAIQEASEALLILKLPGSALDRLRVRIPELHPYAVPELLVLPAVDGHPPYLDWVRSVTSARGGGDS
jgi:periplasmic divalent cation tolerance protein